MIMKKNKMLLLLLLALPLAGNAQIKKYIGKGANGQVKSIYYRNVQTGRQEGHWVDFDENGLIASERDYKDGYKDGKEVFYQNGDVELIIEYRKGKIDGKCIKYTVRKDAGKKPVLHCIANFRNGVEHGMMYIYDEHGKIIRRERYKDGALLADTFATQKGLVCIGYEVDPDGLSYIKSKKIIPFKSKTAGVSRTTSVRQDRKVAARPAVSKTPDRKGTPVRPQKKQSASPQDKSRLKVSKDGIIELE